MTNEDAYMRLARAIHNELFDCQDFGEGSPGGEPAERSAWAGAVKRACEKIGFVPRMGLALRPLEWKDF